ncbi:Transcription antitermination protein RfaH [Methylorubrum populi]
MPRLSPSDFPPEQHAEWLAASADGGRASTSASSNGDDVGAAAAEWVVAYTDPKREADVARTLRRRAFAAYVPAMTVTRRRQTVTQPLLPRYVFIGLRGRLTLYDLRQTPGLEGVVRTGGKPSFVAPGLVAGLRLQEEAGLFDFTTEREAERAARAFADSRAARMAALPLAATVRLVQGPWRGFRGTVVEKLPPDRLRLGMTLFGRTFEVPVSLDDIEPPVVAK